MSSSPVPDDSQTPSSAVDYFLGASADIVGGAAAGLIGLAFADVPGAIMAGAGAPLLSLAIRKVGTELRQRLLGPREEARVGAVLTYAAVNVRDRIGSGEQVRQDGFFTAEGATRSAGEEVAEGILLAAQREYEEKKLKHYGALLSALAFTPEVSREDAVLLLRLVQSLSYRQLCLLALFINKDQFSLKQENYHKSGFKGLAINSVLTEVYDLYQRGLLNCSGKALLGDRDINPSLINAQGHGIVIYHLGDLFSIDPADVAAVALILGPTATTEKVEVQD